MVRKYDLNQNGPRALCNPDGACYDPTEDPSYNFAFKTPTYSRQEGIYPNLSIALPNKLLPVTFSGANGLGDVTGRYSYLDDVGERHNVEYIAGRNTGFHVRTPYPDSNPAAIGPLFFNGRGRPLPRGRTSIQRGLDGSYR